MKKKIIIKKVEIEWITVYKDFQQKSLFRTPDDADDSLSHTVIDICIGIKSSRTPFSIIYFFPWVSWARLFFFSFLPLLMYRRVGWKSLFFFFFVSFFSLSVPLKGSPDYRFRCGYQSLQDAARSLAPLPRSVGSHHSSPRGLLFLPRLISKKENVTYISTSERRKSQISSPWFFN